MFLNSFHCQQPSPSVGQRAAGNAVVKSCVASSTGNWIPWHTSEDGGGVLPSSGQKPRQGGVRRSMSNVQVSTMKRIVRCPCPRSCSSCSADLRWASSSAGRRADDASRVTPSGADSSTLACAFPRRLEAGEKDRSIKADGLVLDGLGENHLGIGTVFFPLKYFDRIVVRK